MNTSKLIFHKYQGCGNDLIIIDNRNHLFDIDNQDLIANLCDRHFGIGADGLMLLNSSSEYDFEMQYFNSDGKVGSMCGNGGRCIVAFAEHQGIIKNSTRFLASDGSHYAEIIKKDIIRLQMNDVETDNAIFINTGSPHHLEFVEEINDLNVFSEGKQIRFSKQYAPNGTNVNFIKQKRNKLFVRTYERGVEDETLSCGTGVVASAIAFAIKNDKFGKQEYIIETKGGKLKVQFQRNNKLFVDIFLEGYAKLVFKGEIGDLKCDNAIMR